MAEEEVRSEDEERAGDAMVEEDARGQKKQVVARVIKKQRLTKAQQKNEALYAHRESEKIKGERKRAEIKARLKNKKEVKLEPTLLKSYQDKFETESKKLLGEKKLAPGKRKRLKKRAHYIKKQLFDKYIEQVQTSKNLEPSFEMSAVSKELRFIEFDLEKEKQKFIKKDVSGVSSNKAESTAFREVNHISKVLQNPAFKADPLAVIKQHLTNNIKDKSAK